MVQRSAKTCLVVATGVALVGAVACLPRRHAAGVPCTAKHVASPPPVRDTSGAVQIRISEYRGRPDQYPLVIVVDGRVLATLHDSAEAAQFRSSETSQALRLEEIESISVFIGDTIPVPYRVDGVKQVYVIDTCRARQAR